MSTTPPTMEQKRSIALGVGNILANAQGRWPAYAPDRIVSAMRLLGHPESWDCWALSLYASLYDFISYYAARDETRDYESLRISMKLSIGIPVQTRCNPPGFPALADTPMMPESIGPEQTEGDSLWTWLEILMTID